MRFAATMVLSALPLLLAGAVVFSRPAPRPAPSAQSALRVIPLDTRTFGERWPVNALPQDIRVQTTRIAAEIPLPQPRPVPAVDENAASPSPPPTRLVRRASLRLDICARHGLRKVTQGRSWRCRR
jgi:hypothetical protein